MKQSPDSVKRPSRFFNYIIWFILIIASAIIFAYILNWQPFDLISKKTRQPATVKVQARPEPIAEKVQVVIFYPERRGRSLVAQKAWITKFTDQTELARELIKELAVNKEETNIRPLPQGTKLRNLFLTQDGMAYADFTHDLIDNLSAGTFSEYLTVYSLVNTLAYNLKGIVKVKILIEGKEVDTLAGHIDISHPLMAAFSLVKEM